MNVEKLKENELRKYVLAAVFIAGFASVVCGGGKLSATGELRLEKLKPGREYRVKDLGRNLFRITNNTDQPLGLDINPVLPDKEYIRKGFEPLPDIRWISTDIKSVMLEPGQVVYVDVIIRIPRSKKYSGRKYQFHIWTKTIPGKSAGIKVSSGVESVFLVTTSAS